MLHLNALGRTRRCRQRSLSHDPARSLRQRYERSIVMNQSFNGKVALVTGAGSGMGLATAKAFAEASASVVLADIQEEAVRAAAEQLIADGRKALAIRCDVSDDVHG